MVLAPESVVLCHNAPSARFVRIESQYAEYDFLCQRSRFPPAPQENALDDLVFTLGSDDRLTRETQFAAFATGPCWFWRQRRKRVQRRGRRADPLCVSFRTQHQRVVVKSAPTASKLHANTLGWPTTVPLRLRRGDRRSSRSGRSRRYWRIRTAVDVISFARLHLDDFEQLCGCARSRIAPLPATFRAGAFDGRRSLRSSAAPATGAFDAAAFCAPMFGVVPMLGWLADRILDWVEHARRSVIITRWAPASKRPLPIWSTC